MKKLYLGLMSGTSMDGIDVALMDVNQHSLIGGKTYPYSEMTRTKLEEISHSQQVKLSELTQLNTLVGREFAMAANQLLSETGTPKKEILAIGSHGQTVCHDVSAAIPYTLQLGCPQTIAQLTSLTVVADFRVRDVLLGGKGAPFAPLYHLALFANEPKPLAVVNIGGVANLTLLADDGTAHGYDIGPGNCLMDAWIRFHRNLSYDKHGSWAKEGKASQVLLDKLLTDPYFQILPPKSIGKEYFDLAWLKRASQDLPPLSATDTQATLLHVTAFSIAQAIRQNIPQPKKILICGGGARNNALMEALRLQLTNLPVISTEKIGINPDFIEAMMFAWLADKTLQQIPVDLTSITGASQPTILGIVVN